MLHAAGSMKCGLPGTEITSQPLHFGGGHASQVYTLVLLDSPVSLLGALYLAAALACLLLPPNRCWALVFSGAVLQKPSMHHACTHYTNKLRRSCDSLCMPYSFVIYTNLVI